jgi:uncharacterized protein YcnI
MKKMLAFLPLLALLVATTASAHVTVKPGEVGVGSFQTFTVSVPSEKDLPTTSVRLVVPEGMEHVSPTVKPGWNIKLVSEGEGDHGNVVKEVVWSGGSIPAQYRDDFTFSAKVPGTAQSVVWKAYQTYRDGSVVAWELGPNDMQPKKADGTSDFSAKGPASVTKVIDDLSAKPAVAPKKYDDSLFLAMIAVVISVYAVYRARRK